MERLILHRCAENPEDRVIADLTVQKASRELRISTPPVHFFHPSSEDIRANTYGFYVGGQIFLNCRLSRKDLIVTALHETRHHYQAQTGKFGRLNQEMRERDARMFELYPRD